MSASSAAARKPLPLRPTTSARSRPKLIVLAPQRVVGRTPFVVLVGGLLLAGLIALLMLHTLAAQDAYRQTSLQQRLAALTDVEQHLEQQVQLDSSPVILRQRAKALGLVPSVVTGYRRLANGRVIAHEVATAPVVAIPAPEPTASAATKASATASSTPTPSATKATKHHHRAPRR